MYQSRPLTPTAGYSALAAALRESNLSVDHGLALIDLVVTYGADGAFSVLEDYLLNIRENPHMLAGCSGPTLSCETETTACGIALPGGGYSSSAPTPQLGTGNPLCDPVRLAGALNSPQMKKKAMAMG